jgi:hypothetical protein
MDQSFDEFTGLATEAIGSRGWLGMGDGIFWEQPLGTAYMHRLKNMTLIVNK